jgi:hypothetical protein
MYRGAGNLRGDRVVATFPRSHAPAPGFSSGADKDLGKAMPGL